VKRDLPAGLEALVDSINKRIVLSGLTPEIRAGAVLIVR